MAVTLPKPSITDIVDDKGSVTGGIDSGSRTDDTVLVIEGKARAGTTVEVFDGDVSLGSTKASPSGKWNFTTAELDAGGHAFTVVASNAKGDTSPASTAYRITVDTVAPTAPAFTVSDDAGRLVGEIAPGTRTDDASPTLSGKTEARATVEVFDGSKSLGTVTANGKGVWSYMAEDLKDGLHTLRAIATDTVGNSSEAQTFRLTIDTKPPKAPTLTRVTDNTGTVKGSVPDNGSTNDKTPTLAGNAPAGAAVEIFDADRSLGTVTAAKNGAWTFTTPALDDGLHTLTAVTVDALGTFSEASNAITINLDTLPPEPPVVASVNDNVGKVKGNVADGKTTDDTTLVLKGVVDADSEVSLYDYDTRIGVVSADGKGQWSFTTDELDNGSVHVFTARVRDAVGNLSDAGASRTVAIATGEADTVAPFAPTLDTVTDDAGEVTGPVKNKGQSDDATLTLSGTAEANSTVEVFDAGDSLGTVKASKSGDWIFTTAALDDGKHVFTATATDAAKNVSDLGNTFTVNVDAAAPAAPVIGSANDDAGRIKGDLTSGQATDDALPVLKGTAEAGSRVELFDAGVSLGTVKAGKAGGWTFTPADELKDGGHSFTATATDSAGNTSTASAAFTLTVNTRQPSTPDITRVSDNEGRVKGTLASGGITDDTTLSLTGKAAADSTVEIFDGSLSLGSVTAKAGGAWSFVTPKLAEGVHSLTAVASNAVGSVSPASDTFDFTINTQPPQSPVIVTVQDDVGKTRGPVANNGKTDDTTPTLSGTATAGITVEVLDYDTRLASLTADQDGRWTYTSETLENGSIHVFSARAVDGNGLVSASGNDYTLTISTGEKDTTPPFAPSIDTVSDDQEPNTGSVRNKGKSNDATLTLSGTAEANSTVEIFDGEDSLGTVKTDKGGDWTFTTAALDDGQHVFTATATDAAKNASEASKSYTVTTDATAPTLSLSSDKANLKAGETATLTFSFSEAPTGFAAEDVSVSGGSLSGLKAVAGGKAYTGVFTPTANTNAVTASVNVEAGSYTDAVGNNGAASNTLNLTADTLAPGLTLSSDKTSLKSGETATLTFNFSEAPTGFAASDISVSGGSLSNFKVDAANNKVYTGLFTPTANTNAVTASVNVAAGSYSDAAGNTGAASNTLSLTADTLAPTLTLSSDKASLKTSETATLTFSFSEAPTGFEAKDVSVSGGTVSGLKASADAKVYTAVFTPTDKSTTNSISVAAASYSDAAGNNGAASNVLSLKLDGVAPTLSLSSDKANLKAGETATLSFTFSEAPTGFAAEDVSVTGGSLSNLKVDAANNKVYTGLFTPTANTNVLTASVSVAAGSYTGATGTAGTASNTLSLKGDTQVPEVTVSTDKSSLKIGETALITFTFTEPVTGFESQDINATAAALAVSGFKTVDSKTYTAVYTPLANSNNGSASINVIMNSYADTAGNIGTNAKANVIIAYDTQAPTLTLSSDKASLKAGETAALTFTFSEAPTGFAASDISVTGGSLSNLKVDAANNKVYTGLFTPTANTNAVTASVNVAAGSYTDAAGNAGGAGSAVSIKADTLTPTLTLSSDKASLKAGETATLTFTFSEAPTGFAAEDVSVTGGSLSNLKVDAANNKVYTGLFTPTANTNAVTASVNVAAGSYTDAAGNNGAASNTLSLTADTLAPTLTLSSDKANLKAGETAALTFTFSETPTGFTAEDVSVVGGTLSNFKVDAANNKLFTASYTPTAASGTLSVAAASYTDAAGNNGAASNSLAITANLQVPTLTLSSDKTALKAGETAVLTFTFSEAPTGFALEDIAAGKGSVSALKVDATNSKLYTAVYTPEASNTLAGSVSVAAGSYTGATGTAGAASNSLSFTGDTLVPDLTLSSDKTSFKVGETATISFSFSEAPTGFEKGDVVVTGGTLGDITGTGLTRTALFTPTANTNSLTGAISVAAASYTDAVGNPGTASNSLSLTGDTKAPGLSITASSNTLTFTFDEAPVGFDAGDISTTAGSVGSLSGSGLTRTASFSPPSNASGTASISVASGSYTDAAGNAGGAGSASVAYNTVVTSGGGSTVETGNGSRQFPSPNQTNVSDVLTATTGSVGGTAVSYTANGDDQYVIQLGTANSISSGANVEITGFGSGDKLVFAAVSGSTLSSLESIYTVVDDGTDVSLVANDAGTVQFITLKSLAGSRSGVYTSIDSLTELDAFIGTGTLVIDSSLAAGSSVGNGTTSAPSTLQSSGNDVLRANVGSVTGVAVEYNAGQGVDQYVIATGADFAANVRISNFSGTGGDKLWFDTTYGTLAQLSASNQYSIADDGTDVSIYANNGGTIQQITLVGQTASRTDVSGSIDNLSELYTFLGGSAIEVM